MVRNQTFLIRQSQEGLDTDGHHQLLLEVVAVETETALGPNVLLPLVRWEWEKSDVRVSVLPSFSVLEVSVLALRFIAEFACLNDSSPFCF